MLNPKQKVWKSEGAGFMFDDDEKSFVQRDAEEFNKFLSGTSEFEDHPLYGRLDHKAKRERVSPNVIKIDGVRVYGDPKSLDFYFGNGNKK